jgi:hypothetical protein
MVKPLSAAMLMAAPILTSCSQPVAKEDVQGLFEHCAGDHCETLRIEGDKFTQIIRVDGKLVYHRTGHATLYGSPPFNRVELGHICVASSARKAFDCMKEYPAQIEKRQFVGCRVEVLVWDQSDNIHSLSKSCG